MISSDKWCANHFTYMAEVLIMFRSVYSMVMVVIVIHHSACQAGYGFSLSTMVWFLSYPYQFTYNALFSILPKSVYLKGFGFNPAQIGLHAMLWFQSYQIGFRKMLRFQSFPNRTDNGLRTESSQCCQHR